MTRGDSGAVSFDGGAALRGRLEVRAAELGFARLGVAEVAPLEREGERLREWLASGHHASMGWMADTAEVRVDPSHAGMLPSATRVIVLATPYARADGASEGPAPGVVARYARGRDYHNVVGKRLRKLAAMLKDEGFATRAGVDTLPILERAWAQRAGVGFVGKNCCLIVPGLGSHVFLSAIVTEAPLPADAPMRERCGSCRLCLDACPTDAFTRERELDSARCISYLTIEHEGPIEPSLRAPMGAWIFGCDACQDVCPFNRTAPVDPARTEPFAPTDRFATDAAAVLAMDEERFAAWANGSPLKRPGREGMARNAALVLGNAGDRRHLPVLTHAAAHDESPVVRDAAAWALERLTRDEP